MTVPLLSKARLNSPPLLAATAVTPLSPLTWTGKSLACWVPCPSCPDLLFPQARMFEDGASVAVGKAAFTSGLKTPPKDAAEAAVAAVAAVAIVSAASTAVTASTGPHGAIVVDARRSLPLPLELAIVHGARPQETFRTLAQASPVSREPSRSPVGSRAKPANALAT